MSQAYSNPDRADDPHTLPNIEVFYSTPAEMGQFPIDTGGGWYWWSCFPGCLPDSDPVGPFDTEAKALSDAQDTD